MKRLVESAEATVTEEDERRVQAAADERFLAQRRWKMSEQPASRR
jgi:heme oxygenase